MSEGKALRHSKFAQPAGQQSSEPKKEKKLKREDVVED